MYIYTRRKFDLLSFPSTSAFSAEVGEAEEKEKETQRHKNGAPFLQKDR